jgi:hypothetical protein
MTIPTSSAQLAVRQVNHKLLRHPAAESATALPDACESVRPICAISTIHNEMIISAHTAIDFYFTTFEDLRPFNTFYFLNSWLLQVLFKP